MSNNVKDNYDESETFRPMRSPDFDFKKHYIPLMKNYKAALWKLDELESENQRLREALQTIADIDDFEEYPLPTARCAARAALLPGEE